MHDLPPLRPLFHVVRWLLTSAFALSAFAVLAAEPFPAPINTQAVSERFLTPQEALRSLRMPQGFQATLFAGEPDVQQPISITTDERGRLWVAECYTYAESKTNFSAEQRDRIVVLEDTDGDGRCDVRKVFWDQAQKLTSVEVGFGGVWALCAPHLLFIPDRNRDDVPDGEPVVLLDGWDGGAVRHNIVNGLKWGPDGWLYGRHGILATSLVGKPGASESQRVPVNTGLWRYHPQRQVIEMVANGTTNPWGFDYDEHGEMFFINTVIGHLWHIVPGAHFRRMYGVDRNRFTYQLMEQCADHFHWNTGEAWSDIRKGVTDSTSKAGGGHAHSGLMIYLGDNWPSEYRNSVFTLNLHGRRVNHDTLRRHGAGYLAKHADDFLNVDDVWFRGLELIYGPDGGVYIIDWSDIGECHENDGVHRTSGRIYKVTYGPSRKQAPRDWSQATDAELVKLQTHANDWFPRTARRLLHERAVAGRDLSVAAAALRGALKSESTPRRLRALWALASMNVLTADELVQLLSDPDEHIRAWGVRLLVDGETPNDRVRSELESLAARESSGLVMLYLASAMQRLPVEQRWKLAMSLASKDAFANDPELPLLVWYGIEPSVPRDARRSVELALESRLPIVRRFVARRWAEEIEQQPAVLNDLLSRAASLKDETTLSTIVVGVYDALRGWRRAPAPQAWPAVAEKLGKTGNEETQLAVRELSLVFGDGRAAQELVRIVNDGKADLDARRAALRSLASQKDEQLLPLFKKSMSNRDLMAEAIRGLANYSDAEIPRVVLDQFARLTPEVRQDAIALLASRESFAFSLLQALEEGKIRRQELSAFHARQILNMGNEELKTRLSKAWGDVRGTSQDKEKLIQQVRELTSGGVSRANLADGRRVFDKTCANCHVMYGQGRKVGPDLTGANRKNKEYLLENILDPSATVAADFRSTIVVMKDGRAFTGVVGEQTPKTISLLLQKESITLQRDEIEETKLTALSLMPDGLLAPLSKEEIVNLFGYLMGTEQVSPALEPTGKGSPER